MELWYVIAFSTSRSNWVEAGVLGRMLAHYVVGIQGHDVAVKG